MGDIKVPPPPHVKFNKQGRAYADMDHLIDTELNRIMPTKDTKSEEIELLDAMRLFDAFPRIVLQRAVSPDGTKTGYRCSIPLYENDPDKEGRLMATVDGDGDTAAEAIRHAIAAAKAKARAN